LSKEYELIYRDKEKEQDLFNNPAGISLQEIRTFGTPRLLTGREGSNMLIFGDNLSSLKTLIGNPSIRGNVRLVYIDPPFSTNQDFKGGNSRVATISSSQEDEVAYEDRLIGADYLEFLRKRLIFLRELLADDGSIYVHIDWKKGHYVKVLMDEVFGEEHFINDITRIKCNPKNFARPAYGNVKDMILFYSKTDSYIWNEVRQEMDEGEIRRLFLKVDKDGRKYTTIPLHAPEETKNGPTGQLWKGLHPPRGRHWRTHPDELTKLDEQGLVEWSSTGNQRKKIYADEVLKNGKNAKIFGNLKTHPTPPTQQRKMLKCLR